MGTVVVVSKVGKQFKGQKVLHDVSFAVNRGEILGVLGPNGAGKSTLMRSLRGKANACITHGRLAFGENIRRTQPLT